MAQSDKVTEYRAGEAGWIGSGGGSLAAGSPASRLQSSPLWLPAIILVVMGIAAAVMLMPYPPLMDFLEWVYQGKILALLLSGNDLGPIRIAQYPVPNSTSQVILGLLCLVMPASMAASVFLLGFIAAASLVAWSLAARYQPALAGPLCLILMVSIFFCAPFWNGFANYGLALVLFGGFLLLPENRRVDPGPVLLFSLVIFFTHLTVFVAFLVLVGLQALALRRIVAAGLAVVPSILLAGWYYLALDRGRLDPGEPTVGQQSGQFLFDAAKYLAYKLYTFTKIGPYHNFVFSAGGDVVVRPPVYWAGVAVNGLYALLCLALLGLGLRDALRNRSARFVPLAAAAVLGLAFLLMPAGRLIANTGERFMYPALLLLLLSLPLHRGLTRLMGGIAVLLLVSLTSLASGQQDWSKPLPEASWAAPQRVLYQHRPTAFAASWFTLDSLATGRLPPGAQLSFETSLLISSAPPRAEPRP
ncbi:hypothetical protein [Roseicella aquatilis]|uniref:Glycosyltransferase RgtA/B/C/D-like domain-containing protein n=1 Tax=Roseicella aquatilis TaxID=2527868 RepID=A0A4R4DPI8_9PROT|nr:hypothetical protein [Roseicella aquatilis]TCZ63631.1 hypothetical protein EXY23_09610 [Roseicella aquatilis]